MTVVGMFGHVMMSDLSPKSDAKRHWADIGPLLVFTTGWAVYNSAASVYPSRRRSSSIWRSTSKTAKALGLEIPPTLLARADEVIE